MVSEEMVGSAYEAACVFAEEQHIQGPHKYQLSKANMRAALEAVAPMIRNAALEEAALMIEGKGASPTAMNTIRLIDGNGMPYGETYVSDVLAAAAIRALATPSGEKPTRNERRKE